MDRQSPTMLADLPMVRADASVPDRAVPGCEAGATPEQSSDLRSGASGAGMSCFSGDIDAAPPRIGSAANPGRRGVAVTADPTPACAACPGVEVIREVPPSFIQNSSNGNGTLSSTSIVNQPISWVSVWTCVIALSAVSATFSLFLNGGQGRGLFIGLLCFSTLLLAAGFDSATGRIPNPITYAAILLGLSMNCMSLLLSRAAPALADHWLGAAGPTQSLMGFLIFGGIGLVSRAMAGLGGGDMKLLAAVGALLGTSRAADAMIAALIVAVVYALANLFTGGRLNAAVRFFSLKVLSALYPQAILPVAAHRSRTFPLAIPMFLGLLVSTFPPAVAAMASLRGT